MSKIVLIDGHSILNRAYFGVPPLTNSEGIHTNAVFGFLNILFMIVSEENPDYLTVCFDIHGKTFRHKMYEEYKGQRKPMDPELREQVPLIQEVLTKMGIKIISKEGYEADDLIGTISKRAEDKGIEVCIVSGDKDLLQLAGSNTRIRIPKTVRGTTTIENYYAEDVESKYSLSPKAFIDLKALMGDSSDNYGGAPGIGEKTGIELLHSFGSIDGLYEHIDEITKKSAKESLVNNKEYVYLCRTLATILRDADIEYSFEEAAIRNFYTKEAYEIFKRLGFKKFLDRFDDDRKEAEGSNVILPEIIMVKDSKEIQNIWKECKEDTISLYAVHLPKDDSDFRCGGDGQLSFAFETKAERDFLYIYAGGNRVFVLDSYENGSECIRDFCDTCVTKNKKIVTFGVKKLYPYFNLSDMSSRKAGSFFFDTQIGAYLINPNKNDFEPEDIGVLYAFPIKSYYEVFGKKEISEAFESNNKAFHELFSSIAVVSFVAYGNISEKLVELGELSLFSDIEMPLSYVLYSMEVLGMRINPDELKAYSDMLAGRISALEEKIYEAVGERFNILSPKQLGDILFEKKGLPGGKKTKTGYSTAADVLEKLAADVPYVKDILEYRGLTKLKSTYADGLVTYMDENNRIHSSFNQTITATGRISSTEPNLQNIPMRTDLGRMIRKSFIPKDGYIFADADYSQVELRILAHMSGDEELINAYKNNQDIHRITASKVFNTPFEEVTPLQRRNAKAVNFGIVYGISSFGLAEDLSISRSEAKEYINSYFEQFPGIKRYLDEAVLFAKKNGYCKTLFGRRRPIEELSSSNHMVKQFGERVAMNAPIQGTAADIMKIAMINVYDRILEEKLESRLILQIHDELVIETKPEEKDMVVSLLKEEMEGAGNLLVPLIAECETGANWYEAK